MFDTDPASLWEWKLAALFSVLLLLLSLLTALVWKWNSAHVAEVVNHPEQYDIREESHNALSTDRKSVV